jgi:hypothetical protein
MALDGPNHHGFEALGGAKCAGKLSVSLRRHRLATNQLDMADAQRAGKFEKRHDRWIAPAALQATYCWLNPERSSTRS